MRKVTLIGPVYPYRGGIAHHTTLLAQALQKKNTIQVISFLRQYPKWLYPGASDRDPSQQPMLVEAKYLLDPLNPITWIRTAREVSQFQSDFVIIPWWTAFWAPAYLFISVWLRCKKIPLLYLIHNVLPHEARKIDHLIARLCFRYASGFIVQSQQEQAKLEKLTKITNIEYYPHPVYQPFVGEMPSKTEARQRLNIPSDRYTLLFFGIVRPYKGLNILLEALQQLKISERIEPILIVAGEIWGDPKDYFEMVERLGLKEQVRLYNRYIKNEELPAFFCAADLFVAPYIEGTQSGAVKMALGYRIPIVATDAILDWKYSMNKDPYLVCVPAGDPSSLSKAIQNQLDNHFQDNDKRSVPKNEPDWDGMLKSIEKLANHISWIKE